VVASGALLGLFFVPTAFGEIVNELFLTRNGHLISLWATMDSIWRGLFGLFVRQTGQIRGKVTNPIYDEQFFNHALLEPPLWVSWLVVRHFLEGDGERKRASEREGGRWQFMSIYMGRMKASRTLCGRAFL
jgi:hypothetical protein